MSAGKFTPGPWRIAAGFPSVEAEGAPHLALCNDPTLPMSSRKANTALIASCPDLLQMLHECAEYIAALNGEQDDYCQRARALIARATGEEK